MPEISLKPFDKYKATEYKVKIEDKIIVERVNEIAKQNKVFNERKDGEKAKLSDQVTFDYSATIDDKKFGEVKDPVGLGKNLFLDGFDDQLVGVKKNGSKKMVQLCQ